MKKIFSFTVSLTLFFFSFSCKSPSKKNENLSRLDQFLENEKKNPQLLYEDIPFDLKDIDDEDNQRANESHINKAQKKEHYLKKYQELRLKKITPVPPQVSAMKKSKANPIKKNKKESEKDKELEIEIDQNLSFYCIKNEKAQRFLVPNSCQNYTLTIKEECFKKHPELMRKAFLCIKSRLKR